jgi:lysozyme
MQLQAVAEEARRSSDLCYSATGYALTKKFEGLRLTAYQDQVNVWTIGYGHTGPDVHGGLTITEAYADTLLTRDLGGAVACVHHVVTADLAQCQFDALVDFVFNLGCGSLRGSTLLRHVNAGEFDLAAPQFLLWEHAGGVVVPGLLARRRAEMELFQLTKANP